MVAGCSSPPALQRFPPPPVTAEDLDREAAAIALLASRARELVVDGLRRTGECLGLPDPDPQAVRVDFLPGIRRTSCGEWSFGCTSGWGDSVQVELAAEAFLSGAGELELTARHEGVHAYFRRRLGESGYERLPRWLQEGLAIRFAGQSEAKLVDLLYEESERPGGELAGLEAEASGDQYFEYALAMRFIDGFPGGSLALARRIARGEDAHAAIEAVTGLGRADFVRAARADAEAWLEGVASRLPEAYREGLVRQRQRDFAQAMDRFERVFTAAGISPAGDLAVAVSGEATWFGPIFAFARWAAIAAHRSERLPEAVEALRVLLSLPAGQRGVRAGALRCLLASALIRQGNREEALAEYSRVLRLHHESPLSQRAASLGVARLLCELERHAEALAWIEALADTEKDDPENREELAYLRGLTLLRLGRREEGAPVLGGLAAKDGGSWGARARQAMSRLDAEASPPARAPATAGLAARAAP